MLKGGIFFVALGLFIIFYSYSPSPKQCGFVHASALHIRQEPNLNAAIIGTLQQNTKVCYNQITSHFAYLQDKQGWIALSYLRPSPKQPLPKPKLASTALNKKIILKSRAIQQNEPTNELKEAQYYFANQNYQKAKEHAWKANKTDPKAIESLEIYAKSLYLLGQKEVAKNLLEQILQKHYNPKLSNLLSQMQAGESI